MELDAQILLLSEIEQRFEQHVAQSSQTIDSLHMQLAQSQPSSGQAPQAATQSDEDGLALIEKLAEADQAVKVLAAEKVQLLEAYELLESDTGRLIDDAVKAHQGKIDFLNGQWKVCLLSKDRPAAVVACYAYTFLLIEKPLQCPPCQVSTPHTGVPWNGM